MHAKPKPEITGHRAKQREAQAWATEPGDGGGIDFYYRTVQEAAHVVA